MRTHARLRPSAAGGPTQASRERTRRGAEVGATCRTFQNPVPLAEAENGALGLSPAFNPAFGLNGPPETCFRLNMQGLRSSKAGEPLDVGRGSDPKGDQAAHNLKAWSRLRFTDKQVRGSGRPRVASDPETERASIALPAKRVHTASSGGRCPLSTARTGTGPRN
ncbi:hypothetical protein VULLAG_LOCUS3442 [Vulpes lagopus]